MKAIKDYSVEDLLGEGRRWVVYPGRPLRNGVGVLAVFENHPIKISIGQVSNLPPVPSPPAIITADDPNKWCRQWSIKHGLVMDESDYLTVIGSSIGAHHRCRQVRVIRQSDTGEVLLQDGYGGEMHLDEECALQLYRGLAEAYDLPFLRQCLDCKELSMSDVTCPWCADQEGERHMDVSSLKVVNGGDSE